jgi:hypothetical protein
MNVTAHSLTLSSPHLTRRDMTDTAPALPDLNTVPNSLFPALVPKHHITQHLNKAHPASEGSEHIGL